MALKGIRIKEKNNDTVITTKDILEQVVNGDKFFWSILYLEGEGSPKGISYVDLVKEINNSKNGYILSWNEMNDFTIRMYSIYWIIIIGCRNIDNLKKYNIDKDRYETVDVSIELFDSSYWEIFTKDPKFYNNLTKRFMIEKYLDTDFQEKQ